MFVNYIHKCLWYSISLRWQFILKSLQSSVLYNKQSSMCLCCNFNLGKINWSWLIWICTSGLWQYDNLYQLVFAVCVAKPLLCIGAPLKIRVSGVETLSTRLTGMLFPVVSCFIAVKILISFFLGNCRISNHVLALTVSILKHDNYIVCFVCYALQISTPPYANHYVTYQLQGLVLKHNSVTAPCMRQPLLLEFLDMYKKGKIVTKSVCTQYILAYISLCLHCTLSSLIYLAQNI